MGHSGRSFRHGKSGFVIATLNGMTTSLCKAGLSLGSRGAVTWHARRGSRWSTRSAGMMCVCLVAAGAVSRHVESRSYVLLDCGGSCGVLAGGVIAANQCFDVVPVDRLVSDA